MGELKVKAQDTRFHAQVDWDPDTSCVPPAEKVIEFLDNKIEIVGFNDTLSKACFEEGKTYSLGWNTPYLQYVDIELWKKTDKTTQQIKLDATKAHNSDGELPRCTTCAKHDGDELGCDAAVINGDYCE